MQGTYRIIFKVEYFMKLQQKYEKNIRKTKNSSIIFSGKWKHMKNRS